MLESILLFVFFITLLLIIYHHIVYPLILKILHNKSLKLVKVKKRKFKKQLFDQKLPNIDIIIPAYNEEDTIKQKIYNVGALDYPSKKLKIFIICDGCTDKTANFAKLAGYEEENKHLEIDVIEKKNNRGKIAILNEAIQNSTADIIALSDVSALISSDALLIVASQMKKENIGLITGTYSFFDSKTEGEKKYWKYQSHIKIYESISGSIVGAHGAFYAFRRHLFQPLPKDTINDDFILPVNILLQGYKCHYDTRINAIELEQANQQIDFERRIRIGSGNIQQAIRCSSLLLPKYKAIAFNFFSGKFLRAIMPLMFLVLILVSVPLSYLYWCIETLLLIIIAFISFIYYSLIFNKKPKWKPFRILYYITFGYIATGIGFTHYFTKKNKGQWKKVGVKK